MKYRFESTYVNDGYLTLQGFLIGDIPESQGKYFVTESGKPFSAEMKSVVRNDVGDRFFGKVVENHYGFVIRLPYTGKEKYVLTFVIEDHTIPIHISKFFLKKTNAWNHFKNSARVQELVFKIRHRGQNIETYSDWFQKHCVTDEELALQKDRVWDEKAPLFSIVIPMYQTPVKYLKELLDSFVNQTYGKFEVCFGDGSPNDDLKKVIMSYQDDRFHYFHLAKNGGISENTNAVMKMAKGDFIVLCDHDDLFTLDALYEFADAIVQDDLCDCIYSDEDKFDNHGVFYQPHFKPDYNVDLLSNTNYISHLFAVRRSLVNEYGMLNGEYDGAQDHDFILRMCEQSRRVAHVPKVLYHWRSHAASTASGAEAKLYAFEAGQKAVRAHYERVWPELAIEKVENGENLGIYHTYFAFDQEPMISIIIPNKDHTQELDTAIRSIVEKSTWKKYEIIVVENNSQETVTEDYYKIIQKEFPHVRVVRYDGDFNYSKINNYGVTFAKGEYLLFLNNDTKLIEPDSLKELVSYAQRNDVGAVGCRLLYDDYTIQHAGVIVGIGVADHAFKGQVSENGQTYFNRAMTVQDYSAVTAAAMMVRKDVFERVNGFDEALAVAFNDIDFCLRLREEGLLVVYNPYACFFHYESKSRGKDISDEKRNRYMSELSLFNERWEEFLKKGDPYYNPNLTLTKTDYSLR